MSADNIIKLSEEYVQQKSNNDITGHDWGHISRVRNLALHIAREESNKWSDDTKNHINGLPDIYIVELGALYHDIADWKLCGGDVTEGPTETRRILSGFGETEKNIVKVAEIVANCSFKGADVTDIIVSLEHAIVQDADRLDAMGAVGISRCFAYGGSIGRRIYSKNSKPNIHQSEYEYLNSHTTSINHFYEKLLLLKERMHTETGKKLAEEKHNFMINFLKQFYSEVGAKPPANI